MKKIRKLKKDLEKLNIDFREFKREFERQINVKISDKYVEYVDYYTDIDKIIFEFNDNFDDVPFSVIFLKNNKRDENMENIVWDSVEIKNLLKELADVETRNFGKLKPFKGEITSLTDAYHLIKGMCLFIEGEQGKKGDILVLTALRKVIDSFEQHYGEKV